jgi:hypothetical protein
MPLKYRCSVQLEYGFKVQLQGLNLVPKSEYVDSSRNGMTFRIAALGEELLRRK